jgi:hypothetical protein
MFKTPAPRTLPHLQTIVQPITAQPNCTDSKIKKPSINSALNTYYFLGFLKSQCNNTDNEKLTNVPSTASKAVLSKSSEFKFGTMLKKVPLKVLTYI